METQSRPVACVSGARGGIGRAVIKALRRDGFAIAATDLAADKTEDDELYIQGDVRRPEDCHRIVQATLERFGRLDSVVNVAGINMAKRLVDLDLERARGLFDVNVWGTVNLLRAAQPALFDSSQASVVTITSINGELGFPDGAAYGMSKAALTALTRTLAVELAHVPVRVNAVAPAIVPTGMNEEWRRDPDFLDGRLNNIPLRRMIEPSEVAEAVAFLAGTRSSAITGDVIHTDGGATIKG